MSTARIKKGDTVIAIAGRSAGKTGKVLKVSYKRQLAIVEGLNLVKKSVRKCDQFPNGTVAEIPAPIALSNIQVYDEKAQKGVRISYVREGDKSVRIAKGTGTRFE